MQESCLYFQKMGRVFLIKKISWCLWQPGVVLERTRDQHLHKMARWDHKKSSYLSHFRICSFLEFSQFQKTLSKLSYLSTHSFPCADITVVEKNQWIRSTIWINSYKSWKNHGQWIDYICTLINNVCVCFDHNIKILTYWKVD